jgi:C-terminal processing protease CtpA/Prc
MSVTDDDIRELLAEGSLIGLPALSAAKKDDGGDIRNSTFSFYAIGEQTVFFPAITNSLTPGTGAFGSIPQADGSFFTCAWGKIPAAGAHILYVYFSEFRFSKNSDSPALRSFFAALSDPDIKGLIVDMRGNWGGYSLDLSLLWGHFIKEPHTFAYTKGKTGDGRLDYTAYIPFRMFPAPEALRAKDNIKIALLVDRYSKSCAELSAMIIKTMPGRENHKVFGETSYGATSPLSDTSYIMFDGGITAPVVPVFWNRIYTPFYAVKCADGNIYEGIGIAPDEPIISDDAYWTAFAAGQDKRLEAAIKWIDPSKTFP